MGRRWAQWLADQTGGKGKILMVNGVQGTGVDQERRQGAAEVWKANPGMTTVEVIGDWDPGKAQTATATALRGQSGLCRGLVPGRNRRRRAAFLDAGVPVPPVAGEAETVSASRCSR